MTTRLRNTALCLSLLIMATASSTARPDVPSVYEDEYVTVRAGIAEVGQQPIHLGDPLSLIIEVSFNNREVRIQDLDEELFQRNWATVPGISLYAPPVASRSNISDERTIMRGVFTFQILDCPQDMPSCPGPKVYELPVFNIGYQIIGDTGKVLNSKSVRFRPWPEQLAVTQALPISHEGPQDFAVYFPDGALPGVMPLSDFGSVGPWLMFGGGLLFLASFGLLLINTGARREVVSRQTVARERWEKAQARLYEDSLSDEEWADMLRRCLTWYCLDVLQLNPCHWLKEVPATGAAGLEANAGSRELFMDVLYQESIAPAKRSEYLDRVEALTGRSRRTTAGAVS